MVTFAKRASNLSKFQNHAGRNQQHAFCHTSFTRFAGEQSPMKISQQDPPDRYKSCNNKDRPQQKSRHHVLNHFQQVGLNKIIQCKEIQGEKSQCKPRYPSSRQLGCPRLAAWTCKMRSSSHRGGVERTRP